MIDNVRSVFDIFCIYSPNASTRCQSPPLNVFWACLLEIFFILVVGDRRKSRHEQFSNPQRQRPGKVFYVLIRGIVYSL